MEEQTLRLLDVEETSHIYKGLSRSDETGRSEYTTGGQNLKNRKNPKQASSADLFGALC